MLPLLLLLACQPAPPSSLSAVSTALADVATVSPHGDDALALRPADANAPGVTLTLTDTTVRLRSDALTRLADAPDDRAVIGLVTQVATLNHELSFGRLALDPASGEVRYHAEVSTGDPGFVEVVGGVLETAAQVKARVATAAKESPF